MGNSEEERKGSFKKYLPWGQSASSSVPNKHTPSVAGSCPDSHRQTAQFHHPSWGGNQLQTYPQADEELLLAARHHAAVVEHWADLLQGLGSKQCGLIAEDVNLSALQPRVRENTLGLEEGTGRHNLPLGGWGQRVRAGWGAGGDRKHLLSETCPLFYLSRNKLGSNSICLECSFRTY